MTVLKFILATGLLVAGPAAAERAAKSPAPSVITNPDWISKPDGEMVAEAYPPFAVRMGVGGRATISCSIDAVGKLQACRVIAETPLGLGFGAAALSMSDAFHMRPMIVNREGVAGGTVRIPIRFQPWQKRPVPQPPSPSSGHALELARKLPFLDVQKDPAASKYEEAARQLELIPRPDISADVRKTIATALRESYSPRLLEAREFGARVYANAFTEAQLASLLAFFVSSAGSAQMADDADARATNELIDRRFNREAVERARDAFCAIRDCHDSDDVLGLARDASGPAPKVSIPTPAWDQRPTDAQIEQLRPSLAKSLKLGGAVRLTCVVGQLGILEHCAIESEAPQGVGFGSSALALQAYYRLSMTLLAQGAVGETVAVLVRFDQPQADAAEPFDGLTPRSLKAMEQASALLAAQDPGDEYRTSWLARMKKRWADDQPRRASAAEWDRAMEALAAGNEAAMPKASELRAAYLTTRLTDAQLLAATRFWRSPAGAAWKAKAPALAGTMTDAAELFAELIWTDTGAGFCRLRDCGPIQPTPVSSDPSARKP